jgi:hypothetical protein
MPSPDGPATAMKPSVTSFPPQCLAEDFERSIRCYEKLRFTFDEPCDGFYAICHLGGLELHLQEAPKSQDERRHCRGNEHIAAAGVDGVEAFFRQCVTNRATILKPLAPTA